MLEHGRLYRPRVRVHLLQTLSNQLRAWRVLHVNIPSFLMPRAKIVQLRMHSYTVLAQSALQAWLWCQHVRFETLYPRRRPSGYKKTNWFKIGEERYIRKRCIRGIFTERKNKLGKEIIFCSYSAKFVMGEFVINGEHCNCRPFIPYSTTPIRHSDVLKVKLKLFSCWI